MVKAKKMNESAFAKILRSANVEGESIRAGQEKKEALMRDFNREQRRYKSGKISRKTLAASARRVNKNLVKLDKDIRRSISRVGSISRKDIEKKL
jgi:hypothetical protein